MSRRAMALWLCALLIAPVSSAAETLRIASYNVELGRDGPGLLLRDIGRKDAQIDAVVAVIVTISPDILALQGFDWDLDARALQAFAQRLKAEGLDYPHSFAARPNTGMATSIDLDGDGNLGGPGDAQGFGAFSGQNGIAVLSRHPIRRDAVQDFSDLLWRDLPGAQLPVTATGDPFPSAQAQAIQRLSSTAHWVLPIRLPDGSDLHLLTFQAGPPVFDGPEDRNGLRNRDEIRLWQVFLNAALGTAPVSRFVLAGGGNLDPEQGEGRHQAIRDLLADPRLQDPGPASVAGGTATVDWPKVGRLRVDYVLPSREWRVTGSGVHWPEPGQDRHQTATTASRHRLVWVDLALD